MHACARQVYSETYRVPVLLLQGYGDDGRPWRGLTLTLTLTPTTTPTTTPVTVRVTGTSFKDNKIYTNVFNDIWNTSDDITVTCSSTTNRFCDAPGDGKNLITTNNPQNLCAGSQAGFLTSACTV